MKKYLILLVGITLNAQTINVANKDSEQKIEIKKKWYETINIRGYSQVRFNKLLETNSDLGCEQCDKS
jgi:hypothetical protein